jgi:glycosyltransferase involved in cell wall biosynthesis
MHVMVDGRWLHQGGIGKFAKNILERRPDHIDLTVVNPPWALADPTSPFRLWREISKRKPDVFWSPGFMPPILAMASSIISIHDLITLEFGNARKRFYYNNVIRPLARRCRSPRMLAAFKLSKLSEDFLFLLSGNSDARLFEVVKGLGLEGSVVFGGVFAEELLPSIYRGAVALVFVSLNEGFGIPNIEAFAAGTPVITSNRSAIPEIVEDAATLVDPTSVEDISNALNSVVVGGASFDRMKIKGKSIARNSRSLQYGEQTCHVRHDRYIHGSRPRNKFEVQHKMLVLSGLKAEPRR